PLESAPEMLGFLNRLPVEFRWSNRFIFLDPGDAERALKVYRRNWFQKRHGLVGLLKESFNFGTATFANRDAVAMAEDADEAVAEASANAVRFGYYTCTLLLFDRDRAVLEATAREVLKQLQHHGFGARIEEANALEAWLGSLPGHGYQNVRRPMLHTLNLADLLPLTSIWPGLECNSCPAYPKGSPSLLYAATAGATPFRLNLHVSDVGHTLILGPTGSGKSTLVGLLTASASRTLTDLVNTLQDHQLRDGLNHYTLAGGLGGLLDAKDDSLGEGPFQVFEIGHLMNLGEKNLVPILLYLFHRVEQRLREERLSLLIVEEAWITALNSVFGQKVEEWLRTLRKKNTAVVFVSQSLADVVGSTRRDII